MWEKWTHGTLDGCVFGILDGLWMIYMDKPPFHSWSMAMKIFRVYGWKMVDIRNWMISDVLFDFAGI